MVPWTLDLGNDDLVAAVMMMIRIASAVNHRARDITHNHHHPCHHLPLPNNPPPPLIPSRHNLLPVVHVIGFELSNLSLEHGLIL